MSELAEQLESIELFSELKKSDVSRLAELFERVQCEKGNYLTHQGEPGDHFYYLASGRATVWHMDSIGVEQVVRRLHRGDYFGVTALFLPDIRDASVRVTDDATFFALERSRFSRFLDDHPRVYDVLVLPQVLQKRLSAPPFDWLMPDEFVVFFGAKTEWALLAAELLPLPVFLVFLAVAIFFPHWIPLLLTALITVVWGFIRWWDWQNDHYVVTNKRVVHHESRLLTWQVTEEQALLHQIQNINLLKPNIFANMFNYGTLTIQTAGREGFINFRYLDNPERCQQIIFGLLEKIRSLAKLSEQAAIRESIEDQLKLRRDKPTEQAEPAAEEQEFYTSGEVEWDIKAPTPAPKPSTPSVTAGQRLRAFLPHFREEKEGVITWHKHWIVLLKAISLPALALLITFLVGAFWIMRRQETWIYVAPVLFVVWCPILGWFLWQYEDWRNELFQMTASHIVDIDRLPLGFRESRRQAALEQIQNINVNIPNLWARLFNYGYVDIETAGPTGDLIFEWVMDPRKVQAEIFARIGAMRARKSAVEAKQKRAEIAQWFAVYHQMQGQEEI